MASGKPVYLHAGAHRTGTSSFQNCLAENRRVLIAAGYDLAYPSRDGATQGRLMLRLPSPRHSPENVRKIRQRTREKIASQLSVAAQALILSEENIPGRMMHFYRGRFYPKVERRLSALKYALPGPVDNILFVVRDYSQLFTSAFRKRSEENRVASFDTLRPNMMKITGGWFDLLEKMDATLKPSKLTVVAYENRGDNLALMHHLLPTLPAGLQEPTQVLNQSATDAALEALQARYAKDETLTRQDRLDIIAQHSDDHESRGYATFSETEIATLEKKYRADLEKIDAKGWLIQPGGMR